MIKFLKISWKNLLSTGNAWTEINLNESKTTLISGMNGSGKSTLLDALLFGLYGRAFRRVSKTKLQNRVTRKGLEVRIEFYTEGKNYLVVRGMNPSIFEVYQDDKLLDQDSHQKDYQATFETQVLKMGYKSFCQVVVLGSAGYVPFMELPAGDRRKVVEDLLDLQIFGAMQLVLKGKIEATKKNLIEIRGPLDKAEHELVLLKKHMDQSQEGTKKLQKEKEKQIFNTKNEIEKLNTKLNGLKKERNDLFEKTSPEEKVKKKLDDLKAVERTAHEKMKNLRKEKAFFEQNEKCPTCMQSITKDTKQWYIEKIDIELDELTYGLEKIEKAVEKLQKEWETLHSVLVKARELEKEISKITGNLDSFRYQLQSQEEELKQLKEPKKLETDRQKELEVIIKEKREQITSLEKERKIQDFSEGMLKDKGIKAQLISKYVPTINKLINKYLAMLDFVCGFNLNEEFEENIRVNGKDGEPYNSFSEGEKFRMNVAILFTWRAIAKARATAASNLLILDEIFSSSLDSVGAEEFLKLLGQLTNENNVFVISHGADASNFPKHYKFEKSHGFSKMIEAECI